MTTAGDLGREFLDRVRADARAHVDTAYADGFAEAAGIYIELLTKKIDELTRKIPEGSFLTEPEQLLLASLYALKSETEQTLHDAWEGASSSSNHPA